MIEIKITFDDKNVPPGLLMALGSVLAKEKPDIGGMRSGPAFIISACPDGCRESEEVRFSGLKLFH